jgi:hypothetical protein
MTPSNPHECPHKMVADLCGLCLRDAEIRTLHTRIEMVTEKLEHLRSSTVDSIECGYGGMSAEYVQGLVDKALFILGDL